MAVQLTKENVILFVVACVALGLSIWAFATPCKKDGFGDTRTYSDFKKISHLTPVTNNKGVMNPWAINNKFLTRNPPAFFGPPFTSRPLPSNSKNPLTNCNVSGCQFNADTITEESFNNLLTAMSKLTPYGKNLVIPKSYSDLSDWTALN